MIPGEIFTSFAKFQGIVSVNDFWFPLGFQERTFASFSGFLVKFCFCTDTPGSIEWLDPAPRLRNDDCFRDSQLSLRTLWSAVIKSPKFTARGTASPLRLLHGALVILVRLQISKFRSLVKWVWTLCLPKSSRLFVIGSKETSWEELAWEPPCNGISSSTKFSLNSCNHSGISESHGFHRSIVVSFSFVFGILLAWVSSGFPDPSTTNSDTGTGGCIFLFSNRHIAHCRWRRWGWRRWRRMALQFHRCPWRWWRCRGRIWQAWKHDRNEVFRVADYPNPAFDEMWFLTSDPFGGISVFIAKLSERQYYWRVVEDFQSQEHIQLFDMHNCLFMRLHFSIGGYDYRRTAQFRQSFHFSITQVLFADHVHWRTGVDNKFSFLRFQSWCRQAPIFWRWEWMLLFHAPSI